jgi:hypothetical protein
LFYAKRKNLDKLTTKPEHTPDMIFAVPFVKGYADYALLAREIRKRGPLTGHSLLVVSDADEADPAYDFGQEIAPLFDRAVFQGVNYPNGRPCSVQFANDLFFSAMTHLLTRPVYAGEPDVPVMLYTNPAMVPTRTGWMKDIQGDYFAAGAPDVFGQVTTDDEGDRQFDGPVAIARTFAKRSVLINFLADTDHWRKYLRSEMLVNFADSDSISGGEDSALAPPTSTGKPGRPKK